MSTRRLVALTVCLLLAVLAVGPVAADAGGLPGRLLVSRAWLYDAAVPVVPLGWFDTWSVEPSMKLHRVTAQRASTPVPPQWSPDGHWVLFSGQSGRLLVQRSSGIGGRRFGRRYALPFSAVAFHVSISMTWWTGTARCGW